MIQVFFWFEFFVRGIRRCQGMFIRVSPKYLFNYCRMSNCHGGRVIAMIEKELW